MSKKQRGHQTWRMRAGGMSFRVDAEDLTPEHGLILQLERDMHRHPEALVIVLRARDILAHVRPQGDEFDSYGEAKAAIQRFVDRHEIAALIDGLDSTMAGSGATHTPAK